MKVDEELTKGEEEMAKNVSAVVSGAGFAASFWIALDKAARRRGLDEEAIYNGLKEDSPLIERFAELIAETASRVRQKVFLIVRDSRPLEEKVKEEFSCANLNITSQNFRVAPSDGPNPEEAVLVNFGEYVTSEDGVARLDKMGLRPGLPTELVDLSKSHSNSSELAACLPIIALGDSWQDLNGLLCVASCLGGGASGCELGLGWWSHRWSAFWWFLAFRK